jgi:hypothetical protein
MVTKINLITICKPSHTTHDTKDIVVSGIDTDLGGLCSTDGGGRDNKLKSGVVNAGEVASSRWLVLLRAKCEREDVNTSVGVACVVLVRLNEVEVSSFALRESVLTVKLKLGGYNRVLSPAVHVEGSLGKDEDAGIRDTVSVTAGRGDITSALVYSSCDASVSGDLTSRYIKDMSIIEKTIRVDGVLGLCKRAEGEDGVGKGINSVGVVERLSSKCLVHHLSRDERVTVGDVHIRLDNPDKLLTRMIEVELNLVGGRTDGLITSELKLLDEVLVGVLCHASALVGVKEDVIDVERSGYERLGVRVSGLLGARARVIEALDGEKALIKRTELDVNLDLVVLEGNKRKSKSGVAAEPELKRDVKCGLRKSLARGADCLRDSGGTASSCYISKSGVGKVGKLGCLTDHLVVSGLLLTGECKLVPDVHPVTILTVDALTTNLNLNHRDHLLSRAVKPAGVVACCAIVSLVNLWECNLKVCSVGKVTISGDSALDTASEIGLSVKSLLN